MESLGPIEEQSSRVPLSLGSGGGAGVRNLGWISQWFSLVFHVVVEFGSSVQRRGGGQCATRTSTLDRVSSV